MAEKPQENSNNKVVKNGQVDVKVDSDKVSLGSADDFEEASTKIIAKKSDLETDASAEMTGLYRISPSNEEKTPLKRLPDQNKQLHNKAKERPKQAGDGRREMKKAPADRSQQAKRKKRSGDNGNYQVKNHQKIEQTGRNAYRKILAEKPEIEEETLYDFDPGDLTYTGLTYWQELNLIFFTALISSLLSLALWIYIYYGDILEFIF